MGPAFHKGIRKSRQTGPEVPLRTHHRSVRCCSCLVTSRMTRKVWRTQLHDTFPVCLCSSCSTEEAVQLQHERPRAAVHACASVCCLSPVLQHSMQHGQMGMFPLFPRQGNGIGVVVTPRGFQPTQACYDITAAATCRFFSECRDEPTSGAGHAHCVHA